MWGEISIRSVNSVAECEAVTVIQITLETSKSWVQSPHGPNIKNIGIYF
jgi:hypothetical protein